MRAHLSIEAPFLENGMSIGLANGQELSIGSSRWADLSLNDAKLSSQHMQISIMSGECWLRDLRSASGTFVNGIRITATEICDGDVIQSGDTKIRVNLIAEQNPRRIDIPDEFHLPRDILEKCNTLSYPNGFVRVSSDLVPVDTIIEASLRFGVSVIVAEQKVRRDLSGTVESVLESDLKRVVVATQNLDDCITDFWAAENAIWTIGNVAANELTWIGVHRSHWANTTPVSEYMCDGDVTEARQFFDRFDAHLVNDRSTKMGWSLYFRRTNESLPLDTFVSDSKLGNRAALSSVA